MDDPLHDLENELKALRPRRPSALLRARVERALATGHAVPSEAPATPAASPAPRYTSATSLRSWKWISWQLAAAASVALAVSVGVWRWQVAGRDPADALPSVARAAPATPAATDPVSRPEPSGTVRNGDRLLASTAPDVYRPVKAANLLYDLQDEGLVLLEDNTPGRRVRARYVDTYTWKNPATNASVKWSVPREEVRVLPANYH
jgi:hypothetical protein